MGIVRKLTGGNEGVSRLRAPLQLSLLISPLYLLCPFQLIKKTYNRQAMLSINRLLGNGKTELIIEVEKAIWNVLFSLAEGSLDSVQLLHHLCEQLPWDKITTATNSDHERHWFNLGKRYIKFNSNNTDQMFRTAFAYIWLFSCLSSNNRPSRHWREIKGYRAAVHVYPSYYGHFQRP